jgi:hypothetical protein
MKLGFLGTFYYDPRAQGWLLPYFFSGLFLIILEVTVTDATLSDPAVVRLSQRLAAYSPHAKAMGSSIPAINFSAYIVIPSFVVLLRTIFFFAIFRWLAQRSWGRRVLLRFPGLFIPGLVSHKGPTAIQCVLVITELSFAHLSTGKRKLPLHKLSTLRAPIPTLQLQFASTVLNLDTSQPQYFLLHAQGQPSVPMGRICLAVWLRLLWRSKGYCSV